MNYKEKWQTIYKEMGFNTDLVVPEQGLASYIDQHAQRYPNNPAIEYFDSSLTYSDLNQWANRYAHALKELGCQKGDVVGIHLPNLPHYLIALTGASKLGCTVSNVSPLLKPDELIHQINDAGIKVLLSLDVLFPYLKAIDGQVPNLKTALIARPTDFLVNVAAAPIEKLQHINTLDFMGMMKNMPIENISTALKFEDVVFIQYTGGTTGRSKGAVLTLRNIMTNFKQFVGMTPLQEGVETVFSAAPIFHAAGLTCALSAMLIAARYIAIPNPRDLAVVCKMLKKFPPTYIVNVPTLYLMLLDYPDFHSVDFSGLKLAISGAAPFPKEHIHRLEAVIGKGKLTEVYGMTETSPMLTANPLGRVKIGTIGIPIIDTDAKIVDLETGLQEMPTGESGQLIVKGPQVMRGYWNLPEETAKAMRQFQGETWLYTGDVAMIDTDGYITICDRCKDMLIVGGYKVFSVEIEDKLSKLPFISLSAVVGIPDQQRPGNDIVVLYVQLKKEVNNESIDTLKEKILAFCKEHMAPYKMPKHIEFIEAIPLTAANKLDKKLLRAKALQTV